MNDPIDVALLVTAALEACRVPYTIGGSLASSVAGEPRASIDADILIDMTPAQIAPFLEALGGEFYADDEALQRAVSLRAGTNLIPQPSGVKVDLFLCGSPLEVRQLQRRRLVHIGPGTDRFLYMHSPEDILLQKLHWYRQGGGVSDRQWRDAVSILLVQGDRLDTHYLNETAALVGIADLLNRARMDAGVSG